MTGFYMMTTLEFNELKSKCVNDKKIRLPGS